MKLSRGQRFDSGRDFQRNFSSIYVKCFVSVWVLLMMNMKVSTKDFARVMTENSFLPCGKFRKKHSYVL